MGELILDCEYKPVLKPSNSLITKDVWKYLKHIQEKVNNKNLQHEWLDEIAYELFDYEVFKDSYTDAAAYCDFKDKKIIIGSEYLDSSRRVELEHIFCHELAHSIQSELEMFECNSNLLLSERVRDEQQADSIAYHLMGIIYPETQIDMSELNSYFDIDSIKWLGDWYKHTKIQNDIIIKIIQ